MKYTVKYSSKFQKDVKRAEKRGYKMSLLSDTVKKLANGETLPERYRDHNLTGDFIGYRECHITPDWLLMYKIHEDQLLLLLVRTGTHSDLF